MALAAFVGADRGRRFEAVHFRHMAIHEDQVVIAVPCRFDGFASVVHDFVAVPHSLEHAGDDFLVHGVVFGDEDAVAGAILGGDGQERVSASDHRDVGHAHCVAQGPVERGPFQGFCGAACEAALGEGGGVRSLCDGCHEHETRGRGRRIGPDAPGEFDAVYARHAQVDQGDVEGDAFVGGAGQCFNGGGGVGRFFAQASPFAEDMPAGATGCGRIVYDQDADVFQAAWKQGFRLCFGEMSDEGEDGSSVGFGPYVERSPHGGGQALGDGEAQPGSAEFARGAGVGLGKGLKQGGEAVGFDADSGVGNVKTQRDRLLGLFF